MAFPNIDDKSPQMNAQEDAARHDQLRPSERGGRVYCVSFEADVSSKVSGTVMSLCRIPAGASLLKGKAFIDKDPTNSAAFDFGWTVLDVNNLPTLTQRADGNETEDQGNDPSAGNTVANSNGAFFLAWAPTGAGSQDFMNGVQTVGVSAIAPAFNDNNLEYRIVLTTSVGTITTATIVKGFVLYTTDR